MDGGRQKGKAEGWRRLMGNNKGWRNVKEEIWHYK